MVTSDDVYRWVDESAIISVLVFIMACSEMTVLTRLPSILVLV